jgi:hypothetical protein
MNPSDRIDAAYKAHTGSTGARVVSRQRLNQIQNPEKHAAREAVKRALKRGVLVRPETCSVCGGGGPIEAHHPDYNFPLDVEWLCRQCHSDISVIDRRRREGSTSPLDQRINDVFRRRTGAVSARGARAWFSRRLRVSNRTVTRWCNGTQAFEGPALACLEMLEETFREKPKL